MWPNRQIPAIWSHLLKKSLMGNFIFVLCKVCQSQVKSNVSHSEVKRMFQGNFFRKHPWITALEFTQGLSWSGRLEWCEFKVNKNHLFDRVVNKTLFVNAHKFLQLNKQMLALHAKEVFFKVGMSSSKKFCFICIIKSPLKVMKNAFFSS